FSVLALAGTGIVRAAPPLPRADVELDRARAALQAGNPAEAARAATDAAAVDPDDGEAQLLLGLARFRAGRYDEALAAFDAAARAARPPKPGVVAFNRGATLYKLGRFAEAERAFLEAAAADEKLAAVAMLDAGLAARDGGALERAEQHAARAAELPR